MNRRQFVTGAGVACLTTCAAAASRFGSNESIHLGFIGLGVRGMLLLKAFNRIAGVRIAALCDPDQLRLAKAAEEFPLARTSIDLRRVIEDDGIDAVVIATGNHWHCLAAIMACRSGKDVYVEKPLGHNLAEQEALIKVARETGRIVQVGTQQRSDPAHKAARRWLHEEKLLGKITGIVACRAGIRQPIGARETALPIPRTTDYGLWLGPAKREPLFRDSLHYDWHWDWNTGSGEMGNWGVHIIDDLRSVALADKIDLPKRVVSAGGRIGWNDAGETPNLQAALFECAPVSVKLLLSNLKGKTSLPRHFGYRGPMSGYVVRGEGGTLSARRGKYIVRDNSGAIVRQRAGNGGANHQRNFIDALRQQSSELLNAPLMQGHASSSWCHLANIACLQGQSTPDSDSNHPADWAALSHSLNRVAREKGVGPMPAGRVECDDPRRLASDQLSSEAMNLVARISPSKGFDPLTA
ncbi:MAG: Gfo/Idh/MocA family oxidoreductase [Planctomycetota bacterium]